MEGLPVTGKSDLTHSLEDGIKRSMPLMDGKTISSTNSTATSPGSSIASPEALTPASSITSPDDTKDELMALFDEVKVEIKDEEVDMTGSAEMPMESIDDLIDSLFGPDDQESEPEETKEIIPSEEVSKSSVKSVDMSDLPENIRHFFPDSNSQSQTMTKRPRLDDFSSTISTNQSIPEHASTSSSLHSSSYSHASSPKPTRQPPMIPSMNLLSTPSNYINTDTVRRLKEQMIATHTLLTTYTALKTAYAKVCNDLQKTVATLKQTQSANYQFLMESNYLKCENNILSKEKHMLKEALSKFHKDTNTTKVQLLKAEISLKNDEIVRLKRKCQELV